MKSQDQTSFKSVSAIGAISNFCERSLNCHGFTAICGAVEASAATSSGPAAAIFICCFERASLRRDVLASAR